MAMGCHHDNFDLFASRHHAWNSTRVGPKRDIVGTWEPLVRDAGLKFGVSNHSSHAWHWYQVAYGYDAEGPMRGRRYDAYWLRKKHGRGKFWEGLDPQELYTGPYYVPPDGIGSAAEMNAWHDKRDGQWIEAAPPVNPRFVATGCFGRTRLVDNYRPDLVYFDDTGLPFGAARARGRRSLLQSGGRVARRRRCRHVRQEARGRCSAARSSRMSSAASSTRSGRSRGRPTPASATGTTTAGSTSSNGYKSAKQVIQRLADVVSKNGNLLLNIPVRGDGTIDEKEEAIVDQIAAWTRAMAKRSSARGRGASSARGRPSRQRGC